VNLRAASWIAVGILLPTMGCAPPAQLGGLGVFNPRGFEGRLALTDRLRAPPSPREPAQESNTHAAAIVPAGNDAAAAASGDAARTSDDADCMTSEVANGSNDAVPVLAGSEMATVSAAGKTATVSTLNNGATATRSSDAVPVGHDAAVLPNDEVVPDSAPSDK
jgi:hypothetical protein